MKSYIYNILTFVFNLFPIQKHKVFFLSYYGSQYGCNPKYLSIYMTKHCTDWDVVWGFTEPNKYHIIGVRKVKYLSLRYFYEVCTSQVFVTNYRMTSHYRKRKGQLYLQTWHSSLRLKMIEGDAEATLKQHYVEMAKKDSKNISALLSGCQYSTDIFQRAFWYNGPIVSTGTPREDLMFSNDKTLYKNIKQNLRVKMNEHIILYAPTFRKDNSLDCYNIDFRNLNKTLSYRFGGEWRVVLRLHPHLCNYSKQLIQRDNSIIDATAYDDIQELLFVADVVVSDYSSLIFDFALTKRPCFLYTVDLEQYTANDRQLYFDISKLPFPVCRSNEELQKSIALFDEKEYQAKLNTFDAQIGSFETGNSCRNVTDYILKQLEING